eukprot:tig00020704_g13187.t1
MFADLRLKAAAEVRLARYNLGPASARKALPYIMMFCLGKLLRSVAVFMVADFQKLEHIPVAILAHWILAGAALVFLVIRRPWRGRRPITQRQWIRIGTNGCALGLSFLLWVFAIKHLGPFRSLAWEYADAAIVYLAALAAGMTRAHEDKTRGSLLLLLPLVALLFTSEPVSPQDVPYLAEDTDLPAEVASRWELLAGAAAMLCAGLVTGIRNQFTRRLSAEIGPKRVFAWIVTVAAAALAPVALLQYYMMGDPMKDILTELAPLSCLAFVVLFSVVASHYVDAAVFAHVDSPTISKWGSLATFFGGYAVVLIRDYGGWSGGAGGPSNPLVLAAVPLVFAGVHYVTRGDASGLGPRRAYELHLDDEDLVLPTEGAGPRARKASTYNAGKPSWSGGDEDDDDDEGDGHGGRRGPRRRPLFQTARTVFRAILENRDSRRIAFFLSINLAFMFVELIYGVITNSLGLISDSFHMAFDCSALVIGLYASYVSRKRPNATYTYGYGRFEVLGGFVNAVFLVFIAFFIGVEAIERVMEPPEISTDRLLLVSVLGLLVNIVGLVCFHDLHHGHGGDGHDHGHEHGHGHGHSHGHGGDSSCGHAQGATSGAEGKAACDPSHHSHSHPHSHHGHSHSHGDGKPCSHDHGHSHEHSSAHGHGACGHSNGDGGSASGSGGGGGGGGGGACSGHSHHGDGHAHSHGDGKPCSHDHSGHGHGHGHSHSHGDGKPCSHDHGHEHSSHGHSHGHSHGDGKPCSHDHGHEHKKEPHKHGGGGGGCSHGHNHNMEGVFLHVLADTLGSVGVIISSLLIQYKGWLWADPVCSLFMATLIFASVIPLLKQSAAVLMQAVPSELGEEGLQAMLQEVSGVEGVAGVDAHHVWTQSGGVIVATLHVAITANASSQRVLARVTRAVKGRGVRHVTVQLERQRAPDSIAIA